MVLQNRKIITIDVGIKNLAIGVLEYTYNDVPPHSWENLIISYWENVNILEDKDKPQYENKNLLLKEPEKLKETFTKKPTKPKKQINANKAPIQKLKQKMMESLYRRLYLLDGVTDILVEQQPMKSGFGKSVGSSRLKTLENRILDFYQDYYLFHPDLPKPTIEPASPKKKLECSTDESNFGHPPQKLETKLDYKQRKAKSIELCSKILKLITIPDYLKDTLQTNKKKADDLADCIMQGVYYLQKKCPKPKKPRKVKCPKPKKPTVRKSIKRKFPETSIDFGISEIFEKTNEKTNNQPITNLNLDNDNKQHPNKKQKYK